MPFVCEDHFSNNPEDSSRKVRDESIGRIETRSVVDEGNTHTPSKTLKPPPSLLMGSVHKGILELAIDSL